MPVVPESCHSNAPSNGQHCQGPHDEQALQDLTQESAPTALAAPHTAHEAQAFTPVQRMNQVQHREPAQERRQLQVSTSLHLRRSCQVTMQTVHCGERVTDSCHVHNSCGCQPASLHAVCAGMRLSLHSCNSPAETHGVGRVTRGEGLPAAPQNSCWPQHQCRAHV